MDIRRLVPRPRRLVWQIAGIVLFGLLLTQAVTSGLFLLREKHFAPFRERTEPSPSVATRIGALVQVLDGVPPPLRAAILATPLARDLKAEIARMSPVAPGPAEDRAPGSFEQHLRREVGPGREVVTRILPAAEPSAPRAHIAVALGDGSWLVVAAEVERFGPGMGPGMGRPPAGAFGPPPDGLARGFRPEPPGGAPGPPFGRPPGEPFRPPPFAPLGLPFMQAHELLILILSVFVCVGLLSVWAARRVTAPLSALAVAAERLGIEGAAPALAETGPAEVRSAAIAFNRMQDRLRRMLEARSRMLASVGHDLRTPLTRLRLRAEEIDDPRLRGGILSDVGRMETLVAGALAYLRGDAAEEPVAAVDLAALIETVCNEFADMGFAVAYRGPERWPYRGRPAALWRALTNLVENATRFGTSVDVTFETGGTGPLRITVADDGPGLPDGEKQAVLEPYYQVDKARGTDNGGMGLGLAIASAIAQAHGGRIELTDNTPQGLTACIELPRQGL